MRSFAHTPGCGCLFKFHVFVELHEGCFPVYASPKCVSPLFREVLGLGVHIPVAGISPATRSHKVYNYNLLRCKRADTLGHKHSPPGSSPRVYIFMGPDKMSALFGKCLSLRDFVLLTTAVPINDPVCILKSAPAALWKA